MNNIFKMPLFKFRQGLNIDQDQISQITGAFLESADSMSEKELLNSLREHLKPHTYDPKVVSLLEGFEKEVASYDVLYSLKDLYRKLERSSYKQMYKHPIQVVLECINKPDDESRIQSIMNELKHYDWIPEVNTFMFALQKTPQERQNILSNNGAKSHPVYSVVESIDKDRDLVYVHDRWMLIENNNVSPAQIDQIAEADQLNRLYLLQQVMQNAILESDRISFTLDETLTLSIGVGEKNYKALYINEEMAEKETTLQSIFESPLVHFMKKAMYPVVLEAYNSLDKFREMDNITLVTLQSRPDLYVYAIDANESQYVYNISRIGNQLFSYDSVSQLLEEVYSETGFDLSYMFENKLPNEVKKMRELEDQEKMIELSIKECMDGIEEIQNHSDMLKHSAELNETYEALQLQKIELEKELNTVRQNKLQQRYGVA